MSVNMKNMKNKKAAQERKERKNMKMEMDAISDPDVLFGKTSKSLGGGMFRVFIPNPKHRNEIIEVTAKAVDKNMARICVNDIVIVVQSGTSFELKGNMSPQNIKRLVIEKRIHADLIETGQGCGEDGIEFEFDEPLKKVDEDDEIDINAI
jgi:malic enzyme